MLKLFRMKHRCGLGSPRSNLRDTSPFNPTALDCAYTQRVASIGEQLDPCSHQRRSDAVERDAPVRNGAEARPIKRPGAHRTRCRTQRPARRRRSSQGSEKPPRAEPASTNCTGARGDTRRRKPHLALPSARPTRSGLSTFWTASVSPAVANAIADTGVSARKKKPPGVSPAVGGIIGRKRPIGRERDRETPQHRKPISHCSNLQVEPRVTFL